MCNVNHGERSVLNCPRKITAVATAVFLTLPLSLLPQQGWAQQGAKQSTQQGAAPQKSQGPSIVLRSTEVVVPVTVKDGNGELVPTLRIEDFRIFDDNVEQRITHISVEAAPLSAVILLDDSLKAKPQKQLQDSIRAIAAGFGPKDEAAIFRFDLIPQQVTDFITDPEKLLTTLQRMQVSAGQGVSADERATADAPQPPKVNGAPFPQAPPAAHVQLWGGNGTKSINDAVYAGAQLLRTRARDRRKVIFLVSDGVESRGNKYSLEDTLRMVISADASIYSIGVGASLTDRIHNILNRLARGSGGDVFYASTRGDLENLYSRVADEARNQYSLYFSPDHKDKIMTYHSIEVRVRLPGLDVHARDGYFSVPQS